MAKAWGMPTWIFMHTLLAKMPDSQYVPAETLGQIKALCSVLPCPDCAMHATQYLAKVEPKHVPTREAFKLLLWRFHNHVNLRTRKPVFAVEGLAIYETLSLQIVYQVFLREFTKKQNIPRLFMDSMMRARIVDQFNKWLAKIKF
jgi:hypothetical protein